MPLRNRQALILLCFVMLMMISNITGMTIALPTIQSELGLSDKSFVWVGNAYVVTYAGTLLLSGRLGDLIGHRYVFSWGLLAFTVASLGCALAESTHGLIAARAIQGIAAAAVSTATLALIARIFDEPDERIKAIGIYVFACSIGGMTGLVVSGILTTMIGWRYIFITNLPVGIAAYAFHARLLPDIRPEVDRHHLDVFGALTATLTVGLSVYLIINANQVGWVSASTFAALLVLVAVAAVFILVETYSTDPLLPLAIFRNKGLMICCSVNVLYATAAPGGLLISLYLQRVLGYSPLRAGLAFVPYTLITALFALRFSAKLVVSYGAKWPLLLGLCLCAAGYILFARAPTDGNFVVDALPGLILLGLAAGVAYNPILVVALKCLPESEAGLASGVLTTSSIIGNALGLATLVGVAAAHSKKILTSEMGYVTSLNSGYHLAFLVAAAAASVGAIAVFLGFPHSDGIKPSESH